MSSVILSIVLVRQFAEEPLSVFYAAFGALISMETTFSKSIMQGLTQLIGVLAGTVVGYLSVFLFMACMAEFEDVIRPRLKHIPLVIALYALLYIGIPFDFQGAGYPLFRCMVIGLFALSFGCSISFPLLRQDISYEIYLVHMPVVNILLELTQQPDWGTFLAAAGLTLLLALTLFRLNRRILNRLETRTP